MAAFDTIIKTLLDQLEKAQLYSNESVISYYQQPQVQKMADFLPMQFPVIRKTTVYFEFHFLNETLDHPNDVNISFRCRTEKPDDATLASGASVTFWFRSK